MTIAIKGLHHNAYRCRDAEETRKFYEDFLGLPLAETLELKQSKTGRAVEAVHIFFELGDGSFLAFFEVPGMPFEFKTQHDFDLHIALEVDTKTLDTMFAKGKAADIETRGISDHEFCRSIYFRDPNGYVIELTTRVPEKEAMLDPKTNGARAKLDAWQAAKREHAKSSAN
jgi:catechol 2,3-dioxygenase-like lactoylglutathione lyase family enzyme